MDERIRAWHAVSIPVDGAFLFQELQFGGNNLGVGLVSIPVDGAFLFQEKP